MHQGKQPTPRSQRAVRIENLEDRRLLSAVDCGAASALIDSSAISKTPAVAAISPASTTNSNGLFSGISIGALSVRSSGAVSGAAEAFTSSDIRADLSAFTQQLGASVSPVFRAAAAAIEQIKPDAPGAAAGAVSVSLVTPYTLRIATASTVVEYTLFDDAGPATTGVGAETSTANSPSLTSPASTQPIPFEGSVDANAADARAPIQMNGVRPGMIAPSDSSDDDSPEVVVMMTTTGATLPGSTTVSATPASISAATSSATSTIVRVDVFVLGHGQPTGAATVGSVSPADLASPGAGGGQNLAANQLPSGPVVAPPQAFSQVVVNTAAVNPIDGPAVSHSPNMPATGPVALNPGLIHRDGTSVAADAQVSKVYALTQTANIHSAGATSSQWIGQSDQTLVTWINGGAGAAQPAPSGWIATLSKAAAPSAQALGAAITSSPIGMKAAGAAAELVAGPMEGLPARAVLRFAHFDPAAMMADAMAAFTGDSANLSTAPLSDKGVRRAWTITGLVIVADVMLAARWMSVRAARKRQRAAAAAAESNSHSLQAGFLPSGL